MKIAIHICLLFTVALIYAQAPDTCGLHVRLTGPGCDGTLETCLKSSQLSNCSIAIRLNSFRIWLQQFPDKPCSTIVKDLEKRIETLNDTVNYTIDTSGTLSDYINETKTCAIL